MRDSDGTSTNSNIQQYSKNYLAAGMVLVPIAPGTKGPREKGWNRLPNCITKIEHVNGHDGGLGLAHSYSGTMALDVDDWGQAVTWLGERGIDMKPLFHQWNSVIIKSGKHGHAKLLFRTPDGMTPPRTKSISVDGVTILEFRCATAGGLTQQDVLPPSIHPDTGVPYEWAGEGSFDAIPPIPDELMAVWQGLITKVDRPKRERDEDADETEVRSALESIDPNGLDYDQWLELMMAVNATGAEWAWAVFEEWSAGSGRDVSRTTAYKWRSLDEDGDITVATLFRRARDGGWRHKPELTAQYMFGDDVEEGGVGGVFDDSDAPDPVSKYMYLKDLDCFINTARDKLMKSEQLNRMYPVNKSTWVRDFFEADKGFGVDIANGITYLPKGPRVHGGDYNVWKGPTMHPVEGDVSPWLDLLKRLVPEPSERLHLLQWMGFTVQHTDKKINHAVLMVSEVQGVGKDTLFEPLLHAIGTHNCEMIFASTLQQSYNSYLKNAKLMIVQEIMDFSKGEMENYLKPMLAAPPTKLEIREKYTKHYSIPNICQFIMFSNEQAAVRVAGSDRRMFCIRSESNALGDQAQVIWDWYFHGGFEKVAYYLGQVDLTGFSPTQSPPMTRFKEDLIESSRANVDLDFEGYLAAHPEFVIFTIRDLLVRLGDKKYTFKQAAAGLRRLGYVRFRTSKNAYWHVKDLAGDVITAFKKGD